MQLDLLRCPSCGATVEGGALFEGDCRRCGRRLPGRAYLGSPLAAAKLLWRTRRPVLVALAGAALVPAGWLVSQFFTWTEGSRYGDEAIGAAVLVGVAARGGDRQRPADRLHPAGGPR